MNSVSDQKKMLRKQMIAQRQLLSKEEWKEKSKLVEKHFFGSSEFRDAQSIHCFISMNERYEVNTHNLIKKMLYHGKEVIVPVTNFEKGTLSNSKLISFNELKPNKWGVLEPSRLIPYREKDIDLVLVPLLSADLNGNRLGYGKGFYDRFLSEISALSFGLLFKNFLLKNIPTDSFDKKLNGLISEEGIIYT